MRQPRTASTGKRVFQGFLALGAAVVLASGLFFILPLLQVIAAREKRTSEFETVDAFQQPPPPPPPPEEEPPEPEPDEPPEEIPQDMQPLDLSQLELALDASVGDGLLGGDFGINLDNIINDGIDLGGGGGGGIDQGARPIYQAQPIITPEIRRKMPGTVYLLIMVDKNGRVTNAKIERSDDPVFNQAALKAIKQWKFEPAKRNGQPTSDRMRQPFTFSQ